MKYGKALALVFLIIILDQALKVYIKTHFYMGEEVPMIGRWARLHFLENEGMAFGMKISQTEWGKLLLSLFRLGAVVAGFFILRKLCRQDYSRGLIICGSLILAGAMGNLIDSLFYGLIFTESTFQIAHLVPVGQGYGKLFHGKVVDMFYFPMASWTFPRGWPMVGGKQFDFFEPVFNLADAAISVGVITLLIFQKRFLHHRNTRVVEQTGSADGMPKMESEETK